MALYIVSYDLNKPEQDYPKLISELKRLGAIKILYSEWLLKIDETAAPGERPFLAGDRSERPALRG